MEKGCFRFVATAFLLSLAVTLLAVEAEPVKEGEKGWESLFNGKDLKGWKAIGKADWSVKDGVLIGKQAKDGSPGDLFSEKEFDDFELSVTYKCIWPCNSGVWFRYQNPKLAYQADILEYKDPEAYSGTVYSPGYKGLFYSRNLDKNIEKRNDWNQFLIRAEGQQITVWLNKKKVGEFKNDRTMKGRVGFQVHPGDEFKNMQIQVKEIKIRLLEKN